MKRVFSLVAFYMLCSAAFAQNRAMNEVELALLKLQADGALTTGQVSFYAVNLSNGAVVAALNERKSMCPASLQKIFTTAAALNTLGPDFRFHTVVSAASEPMAGAPLGNLYITASGDPSLGSRYVESDPLIALTDRLKGLDLKGSKLVLETNCCDISTAPGGWLWEDIGNYFGTAPAALYWRDNVLPIVFRTGQVGTPAIADQLPLGLRLDNEVTATEGGGDNVWCYSSPGSTGIVAQGTLPAHSEKFMVKASHPRPESQFAADVAKAISKPQLELMQERESVERSNRYELLRWSSPPLVDLVRITNQRSVNHYGEALLMATDKANTKSMEGGILSIEAYLKEVGIELTGLRILDGSGLSPQNRMTAEAMVELLRVLHQSALGDAFKSTLALSGESGTLQHLFTAAPLKGAIWGKSGSMKGVKNYAGYLRNERGEWIAFCLMAESVEINRNSYLQRVNELLVKVWGE